jgi:hypothetical protein
MHGVTKDNARTTRLGNERHTPARGTQVGPRNFLTDCYEPTKVDARL